MDLTLTPQPAIPQSLKDETAGPLKITVLVDNTGDGDRLPGEFGLSLLIEVAGKRILFDTGQGPALPRNASQLGVDLHGLDALVLSHGHYDHTGGIPEVMSRNPDLQIYAHPDLFTPRYSQLAAPPHKPIGIPQAASAALGECMPRITWTAAPTRIAEGVWITGAIARINDFEDTGGVFYLDPDGRRTDPIEGDQAMWVQTTQGTVAILGCAHSGVINTLHQIARLTGRDRFHAVLGGMHLLNANQDRLSRTLEALKGFGIQRLGPCHCSGKEAQALLADDFKEQYLALKTGMRLTFN